MLLLSVPSFQLKDKHREESRNLQEQYEAEMSLLRDSLSQHSTAGENEQKMKSEVEKLERSVEKHRQLLQAAEKKETALTEKIVELESQIEKSKEQSNKYNEVLHVRMYNVDITTYI